MSNLRVPSTVLLRTFLKPATLPQCALQLRHASGYMPRHKYAKVTRLEKLHRTQKSALRQEKLASLQRADTISATIPTTTTSSTPQSEPLPFTIVRTPGSQLPVYEAAKNGGNKHITTIRKVSGDLDGLAAELRDVLQVPEFVVDRKGNKKASVAINRLTKQIVVRGWRGQEVKAWMEGVGF